MTAIMFDTHESVKELINAGLPEKHAEAIVRQQAKIIDGNLATKYYIGLVKQDLILVKKDLILKLGAISVTGFVATIGIILGVLPHLLK